MSLSSLYSGFKFLDDSLQKATKSFFQPLNQTSGQFTDRTKANSYSESISQAFSKVEDIQERDFWEEGVESCNELDSARQKKHTLGRSSTTVRPNAPFSKSKHGHTKSLLSAVGYNDIDPVKLHDGLMEVVQSSEAPLLFARGGYDQHIKIPKNLNLSLSKRSSISQSKHKGGFIIVEDNLEDPLDSHDAKVPQLSFHNIGNVSKDNHYDTTEEMSNFLAGKLAFNRATKPMKSQPVGFKDGDMFDPLDSARSIQIAGKSNKSKFGGDHRRICSTITSSKDPFFNDLRPTSTKARNNFSPFSGDTPVSTAMTWERAASYGKNGNSSNFDNSSTNSKHGSIVILEDATSELNFDLEAEETERGSTVQNKEEEEESQSSLVRTKLIEEFKALKSQQLYLKGIYVIPSEDPFVWNCLVFVKGGYYEKGKFKFQIQIPKEYPAESIRVYSLTKVYHPLINMETGEVDLKLCEQSGQNRVEQVLLFIKSIFNESKYLEKVNSFNHEAGSRFTQNPYYFKIKAKESVKRTENNSLNEKENILPIIESRVDAVRDLVKNAAASSKSMDAKVQNLIESITKKMIHNS